MAFADKKGIVVASPFKLQAESMLDVRQQVDTIEERDELVTIKAATAGLRVFVKATKKSYVYNGTSWDELSIGSASLVVKLNGGTSEGTNMFTYNGTSAKTINITPSSIGAAASSHTHTKSQITDFPTSMKNPNALKFAGAVTGSYDGSSAVTITIPNTANTAKSLIVTLNGGTTEGTDKFTFNGSAEKSINITPSTIGAAAATHTHNVSNITGLTTGRVMVSDANGHPSVSSVTATELSYLDGVTSSVQTQLNNKAALNHTHNYAGSSSAGGSANSAVKLATARKINGTSFDGTKDINILNNYFDQIDSETDLNNLKTYGEYYAAGGSGCKNVPSGVDHFYLKVFRSASGYTAQTLYEDTKYFTRFYNGTSWSSWAELYSTANKPTASEIGAAASSHTHTASQITGLPTSLKNPYAITFTGAATGTYDGSRAVTINIPTTGATTKASLVIQLNGGTTEGDDKFTFNGGTAKTVNITPASIGAAAASHGTHVTYSTTAPKANGTASAGTASSVSRSDHVHPAQTTVSGNAGSATKLQTKRNIDGVQFDGSANIIHFGSCSTAAGTAAKVVSCTGFVLASGSRITVKFTTTNTAANPTLNVNSTGAKAIMYRGVAISAGYLAANRVYTFIYDGTDYELVGDINTDTDTTYSTGTASTAGLTRLYTSTGSATNGTMTQKAITDALAGKSSSSHTHNYAGSSSVGGAANSAVKLTTARTINGTSFDGTKNITLNAMYAEDLSNKNVSLNTYNLSSGTPKVKYYFCPTDGAGDGITGRPNDNQKTAFFLICQSIRFSSTSDYITKQTYIHGSTKTTWERYCVSGTWSAWGERYTSQNKPTASEIGAATSSHTHNYAGSSSAGGAANSVKSSLTLQFNGTTKATFNGSAAATVNITPSSIGAAASSHTHNYAGSSSAGGAANSVKAALTLQLNGSTKATFNGSTAATVNITASSIGAAASSHTHSYLPLSGGTVTGNVILQKGSYTYHATGTSGARGYINIATIKIRSTYQNVPIAFEVYRRGTTQPTMLYVTFASANNTDPGLTKLSFEGAGVSDDFAIVKTTTSTWNLYIRKTEAYDDIAIAEYHTNFSYMSNTTVTWTNVHAASLPSGATKATKITEASSTPNSLTIQFNGTTKATFNGSAAATVNITPSAIGAAAKSHTHNYAGSSSAGGAANSVKTSLTVRLNGGNTEGTNKFTFNGSAAKTINITPGSIGAATSSHTHKYAGSSSAGGAANSANRVPVPVGTVLFATSSSTTFFNSCFGGTWEIVGNIDAIVGNGTTLTLYMFRKTKA